MGRPAGKGTAATIQVVAWTTREAAGPPAGSLRLGRRGSGPAAAARDSEVATWMAGSEAAARIENEREEREKGGERERDRERERER